MSESQSTGHGNKSAQAPCYAKVDVLKFVFGLILIVVAVWAFFFELRLFPTPPGVVYWWTVPNIVTIFMICGYLVICGIILMDGFLTKYRA